MCNTDSLTDPNSPEDYFDPEVKCCSYLPTIPNFLVGRIFTDEDPDGASGLESVIRRIEGRVGVNPLGLFPSPVFSTIYNAQTFGKSRSLRCPHYLIESGRCGVWKNRESTCATWFCKYERGRVGFQFWGEGISQLLKQVERELSRWCLLEVGWTGVALRNLRDTGAWKGETEEMSDDVADGRVKDSSYLRIWQGWIGKERDLYEQCAALVNPLSWDQVLSICGPEVRALTQVTIDTYRELVSDYLPPRLKPNPDIRLIKITPSLSRVVTYNAFDPIEFPPVVLDVLGQFDGRTNDEIKGSLKEQKGITMDDGFIRRLADFDILLDADAGKVVPLRDNV